MYLFIFLPDDYENTAIFPLPLLSSADPFWQPQKQQDRQVTRTTTTTAVLGLVGEEPPSSISSSSQSASSDWGSRSVFISSTKKIKTN